MGRSLLGSAGVYVFPLATALLCPPGPPILPPDSTVQAWARSGAYWVAEVGPHHPLRGLLA
jgi:hypothetical protein